MSNRKGSAYLLHFDRKYRHAGHYIGWTKEKFPRKRLAAHAAGTGANLLRVLKDHGIGWKLARVWMGATRDDERKLKNRKEAARLCPVCHYSGRTQSTYTPTAAAVVPPAEGMPTDE